MPELLPLLRDTSAVERTARAQQMSSYVAQVLAGLLREAIEQGEMDRVALIAVDRERTQLGTWWLPGLVTVLVAYPLLAIDQISVELENPFSPRNLNHLPLDTFCDTQGNLLALHEAEDVLTVSPRAQGLEPWFSQPGHMDG